MARTRTMRLSYEKVENSTDVTSSYVKGEKIKKMLKAAAYEDKKHDLVVKVGNAIMNLEHACYQIDLLSRVNTTKAYEIVIKDGISKLDFSKLRS